jgi:hypothetical protein
MQWSFTGGAVGSGTLIFGNDAKIQRITLRTTGLDLGAVIDAFGPPETVWAGYSRSDAPSVSYYLALYFSEGTMVEVNDDPVGDLQRGKQDITRELKVDSIELFTPTKLEAFLGEILLYDQPHLDYVLQHLQPWPGFGKDVIRIDPP